MSTNIEFFSYPKRKTPALLEKYLTVVKKRKRSIEYLDMGCGEGQFTLTLIKKGLVDPVNLTCLDISGRLLNIAKKNLGEKPRYVKADVRETGLGKRKFDFIYSWMVIEHLEDPEKFLFEMRRLLKKDGIGYFSTIMKKPWAIYFYRKNNEFVIDPSHIHEFSSLEEIKNIVSKSGLKLLDTKVKLRYYSFIELFFKILLRLGFIKVDTVKSIAETNYFEMFHKLKIPIIGFYEVQGLVKRTD